MYSISPHIRSSHNQDGMIILDIQRGQVLRLNHTGAFIFEQLVRHQPEFEIVRRLMEEFHVPNDIARVDVHEFLESLTHGQWIGKGAEEEVQA